VLVKILKKVTFTLLVLNVAFLFASCASAPKPIDSEIGDSGLSQESIDAIRAIEREIQATDDHIQEKHEKFKIPIEVNHLVLKWVHFFTVTDRDRFQRFLDNGAVYQNLVKKVLADYGIPTELYYLAMIESGYYLGARSRARAVGPWQFMLGTSRMYGLKTNAFVDERQDIVRSTEAAARYLKALQSKFDSWYLAMAGYNAGEGRIAGAIRRGRSRDFWVLVEKKVLPPETRDYVPKFLAAVIVGRNLKKYGFESSESIEKFPTVRTVSVPGSVRLDDIAKSIDMRASDLKRLNRHILRDITPVGMRRYGVWVPVERVAQLEMSKSNLARHRIAPVREKKRYVASVRKRGRVRYHHVRRGEALASIANQYNVSTEKLKRLNRLKSNLIYAGQRLVLPKNL